MCSTKPKRQDNKWFLRVGVNFVAHLLHRCGCHR